MADPVTPTPFDEIKNRLNEAFQIMIGDLIGSVVRPDPSTIEALAIRDVLDRAAKATDFGEAGAVLIHGKEVTDAARIQAAKYREDLERIRDEKRDRAAGTILSIAEGLGFETPRTRRRRTR